MLSIDTNLVVRYLTGDHPEQSAAARSFIDSESVFVCTTVLLESEWVLRSAYGFTPPQLARAFRAFGGLPGVTVEDAPIAAQALNWMEQGLDFADALHVAKSRNCAGFVTFDQGLCRTAGTIGVAGVRLPNQA
jgi:predicted nucleic-acid-binding protein